MGNASRADSGLSVGPAIDVVKANGPPGAGLSVERDGDGKSGVVLSPGKGKEPGQGLALRVGVVLVRHKLLPNCIGPILEQDLQRLADELSRRPLEQGGTNGLRGNDEPVLVNHYGDPAQFELRRGVASGLAGASGVGRWFSEGRHSSAGALILG